MVTLAGFSRNSRDLRRGSSITGVVYSSYGYFEQDGNGVLGRYLKGSDAAVGGVGTASASHLMFVNDTLVFCVAVET